MRWYSFGLKPSFFLKPFSVIDLVSILPIFFKTMPALAALLPSVLSSSSGLINLRLLRILRLQRVLTDLDTFGTFEVALGLRPSDVRPYQLDLARVVLSIFTLLSVSSGLIYTAEHTVNPEGFPDYFTALYFGLTTLTTVGFGDITPITFEGRLVVSGSILAGVAIIPAQAATLFEALLDFQRERDGEKKKLSDGFDQQQQINDDTDTAVLTEQQPPRIELEQKPNPSPPATALNNINTTNKIEQHYMNNMKCRTCSASPHRLDAFFCWSCGAQIIVAVSSSTNGDSDVNGDADNNSSPTPLSSSERT